MQDPPRRALTRARGLKLDRIQTETVVTGRALTRARGLKHRRWVCGELTIWSRPHTGAWIETRLPIVCTC